MKNHTLKLFLDICSIYHNPELLKHLINIYKIGITDGKIEILRRGI